LKHRNLWTDCGYDLWEKRMKKFGLWKREKRKGKVVKKILFKKKIEYGIANWMWGVL
jgi:hypothetical protein